MFTINLLSFKFSHLRLHVTGSSANTGMPNNGIIGGPHIPVGKANVNVYQVFSFKMYFQ